MKYMAKCINLGTWLIHNQNQWKSNQIDRKEKIAKFKSWKKDDCTLLNFKATFEKVKTF